MEGFFPPGCGVFCLKTIHPSGWFRWSVVGPLASRERLDHGALPRLIRPLSEPTCSTPNRPTTRIAKTTLAHGYDGWKPGGSDALLPQIRSDRGASKHPAKICAALIQAQRNHPKRWLNT